MPAELEEGQEEAEWRDQRAKDQSFLERAGGWQILTWGTLRLAGLVVFEVMTVLAALKAQRRKEKLVEWTLAAVWVRFRLLLCNFGSAKEGSALTVISMSSILGLPHLTILPLAHLSTVRLVEHQAARRRDTPCRLGYLRLSRHLPDAHLYRPVS